MRMQLDAVALTPQDENFDLKVVWYYIIYIMLNFITTQQML